MQQNDYEAKQLPKKLVRKDIRKAALTLGINEARYLVDSYYIAQGSRIRADSQIRSMKEEPNLLLQYISEQESEVEKAIKKALQDYVESHPVGKWLLSIYGIGPVIAAGLLSMIDINQAPTAGHIQAYAGLDPTKKWEKGCKRPWNTLLKTICWHAGQSFMKFSGKDECIYGKLYLEKKAYYEQKNEAGDYAEEAKLGLTKYKQQTDAYKYCLAGKLPQAQIDARARRWAVKIFLSHLHDVWYRHEFKKAPPAPYAIAILGHAHMFEVPN